MHSTPINEDFFSPLVHGALINDHYTCTEQVYYTDVSLPLQVDAEPINDINLQPLVHDSATDYSSFPQMCGAPTNDCSFSPQVQEMQRNNLFSFSEQRNLFPQISTFSESEKRIRPKVSELLYTFNWYKDDNDFIRAECIVLDEKFNALWLDRDASVSFPIVSEKNPAHVGSSVKSASTT